MVHGPIGVDEFDLLDLEASDDSEDSFDSAAEDEFWHGHDPEDDDEDDDEDRKESRTFTKFGELPPELRDRIWEFACADLSQPRVLHFRIFECLGKNRDPSRVKQPFTVYEGMNLQAQTSTARTIMAVNRAARCVALRAAPHTLRISRPDSPAGYAWVRFNKERDVVMVEGFEDVRENTIFELGGFTDDIKQMAIMMWDFTADIDMDERFIPCMKQFPNLERLFVAGDEDEFGSSRNTIWCGSDFVYLYDYTLVERLPLFRRRRPTRICWPNLDEHADYARNEVYSVFDRALPPASKIRLAEIGIQAYPMVIFEDKHGLARFERLEIKWQLSIGEIFSDQGDFGHDSSSLALDDDDNDEPDEYESDGIDDGPIEEELTDDEDEDENNISGDEIFDDEGASDASEHAPAAAHFSSPEPESGDDEVSEESHNPELTVRQSSKRRIVTDSDDEQSLETSRAKRVRTSRVVTSDSEDEDETGGAATGVSSTTVREDSEDSLDSGEEESEEEDEEEEPQPKRMSLAERLRLHREAHPVSSSDEDESGDDDDEDEDDEGEDEDEESGTEDGLIDGIAEESDAEGDGEEDDDEE